MSAEKDDGSASQKEKSEGDLDKLKRRQSCYNLEVLSLVQAVENGCRRKPTRQARLKDLNGRLLPELKQRIRRINLLKA
jgi:hypothetical protein